VSAGSGLHGWLVVDKPVGPTSAQVVGQLKGALRRGGHGKVKIGHGGTLDPLASGVLPIALGEATKLAGYLLNGRKAYRFELAFGAQTATDDAEGEVIATSAVRPDEAEVRAVLPRFTGQQMQLPPAYSALKVAGARAYDLARAGRDVALAPRAITIYSLELVGFGDDRASFKVSCSKGSYVRSLARDLALALGTVGHVSALRRTGAGPFTLAQALPLDKCLELVQDPAPEQALLPLTAGLDDIPVLPVDPRGADMLRHGQALSGPRVKPGHYIATSGSVPVALVVVSEQDVKVLRGFNLS
jgi:tRNA pseudouridine55 synthase